MAGGLKIMVVDDDSNICELLRLYLEKEGFEAIIAPNGAKALEMFDTEKPDLMLLDVMMPQLDGIATMTRLREKSNVPVILLTAKSEVDDKVLGLDSGANDYLTKPFASQELLARIRAMTREQTVQATSRLQVGNITLDRATFELSSPTGRLRLANKEFQMLELLMCNPRNLISTERFLEKIWGYDNEAEINVVWVYISYLRKKLAALHGNIQIKARRNAGYYLEETI